MTYSVLTEPVIPVLWHDGTSSNVGIRDALLHAHKIQDILGDTPLERYALLRLLIAFATDMLHPKNSYERHELFEAGKFHKASFDAYIAQCEIDGPRFDLFDQNHPFMQSKFDESLDSKALKPIATIIHSLPSGNNHVFLDHRLSSYHEVSISKAFSSLIAAYLFCVSGTAGPSSVNNTPPLYTVIIGNNLFETILCNMLSESEAKPLPLGTGKVPWRNHRLILPKEKTADISLLEGLTWMPRRILLIKEERQSIRQIYCQAGLDFKGNDLWYDPHVPRFKKKDETFGTIKPELSRAIWRDVGTLLYDHNGTTVRQPQVLRCITNIIDPDDLPEFISIRATGLITNQAAYSCWLENELALPKELVQNQEQADIFRADVAMIESIQSQLFSIVRRYIDRPRTGSVSTEHEIATQCQQCFLQDAHDLLFEAALHEILEKVPEKEHVLHYCDQMKKLLFHVINHVIHEAGNDSKSMMQQMEAEKWIWIAYEKIVMERNSAYD